MMGARLRARRARPAAILSSTAARALTTAQWIAEALSFPLDEIRTDRRLYLAEAPQILQVIMGQPNEFPELIVVGHNPGFTDLANVLLPGLRLDNMPTAGCAGHGIWRQPMVRPGRGRSNDALSGLSEESGPAASLAGLAKAVNVDVPRVIQSVDESKRLRRHVQHHLKRIRQPRPYIQRPGNRRRRPNEFQCDPFSH